MESYRIVPTWAHYQSICTFSLSITIRTYLGFILFSVWTKQISKVKTLKCYEKPVNGHNYGKNMSYNDKRSKNNYCVSKGMNSRAISKKVKNRLKSKTIKVLQKSSLLYKHIINYHQGALIYAFEHAYEFNPGTINSLITLITNIYKWALSIVSSILKHFNQQWFFSMILGLISDLTDLVKPKRLI